MPLTISYDTAWNAIGDALFNINKPIKEAAAKAVIAAGSQAVTRGRADIARAGNFGRLWQQTWNARFYQVDPPALDAAAFLFQKIPYSPVFEDGATITGKPYLWIPLRTAPLKVGRGKATPEKLAALGIHLFEIQRNAGGPPLLAAEVVASARTKAKGRTYFNVTLNDLKKGEANRTNRATAGSGQNRPKPSIAVPLFFGLPTIHLRKRFHLRAIVAQEAAKLGEYYELNLEVD